MTNSVVPYSFAETESGRSSFFAALILIGLVGAGAGAGLAKFVSDMTETAVHGRIREAQAFSQTLPFAPSTRLQRLEPLVTNLAVPNKAWIRLQASLLLEDDPDGDVAVLRKRIEDDFMSYLRTLTMAHLEGSVGLQHLREDLNERAKVRSKGQVREVILESVVIQ
ncbi:flagellar basal body-associated FliL family protein [Roseibium sp.]|uniref:flagellar basal body-associated FliL family protein n=1 Tax=Roseibium sp. TaxID=1936156 RepID=UPI003B52844D